jgi:hypothetical protein
MSQNKCKRVRTVASSPALESKCKEGACESKKVKKRKQDKNDEGKSEKASRSKDKPKNKVDKRAGSVAPMEVDDQEPEDDSIEIIIDTTKPEVFPTIGWTLDTTVVPKFYDNWDRPFGKMSKRHEDEGLSKEESVTKIKELFQGCSTRTVLATIWGNDFDELHPIQEGSNKVLGYVPSLLRLEKGDTWCLLFSKSAVDAQKLLEQHTVWKEGTTEMVIFRQLTWTSHVTRFLTVTNIPDESHILWIKELMKKPWEGNPRTYLSNAI